MARQRKAATPGPLGSKDFIYIVCRKKYLTTHLVVIHTFFRKTKPSLVSISYHDDDYETCQRK
jgi:hypothetical protein